MQASSLKPGHVLVDTDGHLFEVVAVDLRQADKVHAWLWPDSSPVPNYWQTFESSEDIVSINGEANGGTDANGTVE